MFTDYTVEDGFTTIKTHRIHCITWYEGIWKIKFNCQYSQR